MNQKIDRIIRNIEQRTNAQRVLVVEGDSDPKALQGLMTRHNTAAELAARWEFIPVNGKQNVLDVLKEKPQWLGIVDRDVWQHADIEEQCQQHTNLFVLPCWCIENYLIQPDALWLTLTPEQQAKVGGGQVEFSDNLLAALPRYARHGVLWATVAPLWSRLRQLKFPNDLADSASVETAQCDETIQQVLQTWGSLLDPERVFTDFRAKLAQVNTLPVTQQLALWVHGKHFWRQVVCPMLNATFGQQKADRLRDILFQNLAFPDDLQPLLARMRQWEGQ